MRKLAWLLWVILCLVAVFEGFMVSMLVIQGLSGNVATFVNSACLLVACVLTLRGMRHGRWFVVLLIAWRIAEIGAGVVSRGPGDHRFGSLLTLIGFYAVAAAVTASPVGRLRERVTGRGHG